MQPRNNNNKPLPLAPVTSPLILPLPLLLLLHAHVYQKTWLPPKEEEDLYKVTAAAPFETCVFRLRVARCVQLDPSVTGRVAVVAAAFSMSMASLFWPASRSRPPSKKDT